MSLADPNVADRFNALNIGEFDTWQFSYHGRQKVVLSLMDSERVFRTTSENVWSFYELQFNQIVGGQISVEGPAPGEILQWKAHRESELLAETLRNHAVLTHGEAFTHFELLCEQAKLDVIARDFFLTIVEKGTLERG